MEQATLICSLKILVKSRINLKQTRKNSNKVKIILSSQSIAESVTLIQRLTFI